MGKGKSALKLLTGKPAERTLGMHMRRLEENMRMDLKNRYHYEEELG